MIERLDTSPQKRLTTLEAGAKEAPRTIDERRARGASDQVNLVRTDFDIGVESELGKGSRFFFTLPLNPQRD